MDRRRIHRGGGATEDERLAARGERQLLEFESAMDRQLRRVWVSVVSNELFAVETAEMLERRTN
ncbi:MAG: hypothetical protein NTW75_07545, partial [Planctomycetales bacterium]|nr:hypothetical protein [Planctomycetales bacterium]